MSEKHKTVCRDLNYFEHFIIFDSAFSSCVSTSVFASLIDVFVGIASSAVESKVCAITAEIRMYNSIIKKKKKKHDKMVLLAKAKLNTTEVLVL